MKWDIVASFIAWAATKFSEFRCPGWNMPILVMAWYPGVAMSTSIGRGAMYRRASAESPSSDRSPSRATRFAYLRGTFVAVNGRPCSFAISTSHR